MPTARYRTLFGDPAVRAQFDEIDEQILLELQNNARLSNKDLAARVHLSPSSCLARVRRLEHLGVIAGYHAELDLAKLGRPLQAMIAIRYRQTQRSKVERFRDDMLALPETLSLSHVTGADDFLLHVAIADTDSLRRFVLDKLLRRSEIGHVQSSIMFEHRHAPGWAEHRAYGTSA